MTARIFSDTIELGRTLIDLGDGYAGESVNAAPVLPGRFEVTFQLDGEGAAALDHLLAAAALKVRPSMPPVRSIAQVFEHLKACGYEVTPDEWAPPGYIDLGWIAGGRCRVRDTHVRISGPWGRAYVEGEAATGRFDWYLSDHGRAVHLLGLAGCPVALPMPPENWQNSADPCAGGLRRAPPRRHPGLDRRQDRAAVPLQHGAREGVGPPSRLCGRLRAVSRREVPPDRQAGGAVTEKLTPTVGHCRDLLVFARRHLVTAQKAGEAHKAAWAELAELRKLLAGRPRRWSSRGSCGGAAGRSGTPPARRRKPGGMPGAGAARGPTEPVRLAYRFTERRPACPPWRRSPAGLTLRTWA